MDERSGLNDLFDMYLGTKLQCFIAEKILLYGETYVEEHMDEFIDEFEKFGLEKKDEWLEQFNKIAEEAISHAKANKEDNTNIISNTENNQEE